MNINNGNENNHLNNNQSNEPKKVGTIKLLAILLATSLFTSLVVGGSLYYKFSKEFKDSNAILNNFESNNGNSSTKNDTTNKNTKTTYNNASPVAQISQKVGPSVVGIKIIAKVERSDNPFEDFGGFGFFPENDNGEENDSSQTEASEGSGIVITNSGYIMTNYHVVASADPQSSTSKNTTIEVYLQNQKSVKAEFIGGDSDSDLAVIKIDKDNLTVAKVGDSSKLHVGDPVIAIGNPLGLELAGSVTTGVISALNRSVESENIAQNLIQTDAAINSGNSGGALFNYKGEVIGINSMKIASTGIEGLGFAIPSNEAKPIVDQLIKYKKIKNKPMIGITGQDVSEQIAKVYKMHVGVYVTSVSKDSAAADAGLKKGDIIIKLAGKKIESMSTINSIKKNYKAGDTVKITVLRNGSEKNFRIKFKESK